MAQIIAISSVNAQSGKTLLAAHLGIMLAKDYRVAVMDSAGEKSALAVFLAKRYTLNLAKEYNLPVPTYHSLDKNILEQSKNDYDVIILDSPDQPYLKDADILLTPIRSEEGVASLTDPRSLFAGLIWNAKKVRAGEGKSAFRWILIPNDEKMIEKKADLIRSGKMLGYSIASGLKLRPEYDAGLKSGITIFDKDLPELKSLFEMQDLYARREMKKNAEFIWRNK